MRFTKPYTDRIGRLLRRLHRDERGALTLETVLIIAAIAVTNGLMDPQWAVIIAISLGLSFITGALLDSQSINLYNRYYHYLNRFEYTSLNLQTQISLGNTEVLILGLVEVDDRAVWGVGVVDSESAESVFGQSRSLLCGIGFVRGDFERHLDSSAIVILIECFGDGLGR